MILEEKLKIACVKLVLCQMVLVKNKIKFQEAVAKQPLFMRLSYECLMRE